MALPARRGKAHAMAGGGPALLTRNHRQEALCRAYVHAVAACCGMSSSTPLPDYGIDLTLHDIQFIDGRRVESGRKLDVQAKATTRAGIQEGHVRYDLDVSSYNALRLLTAGSPRILVVLSLPAKEADWWGQSEEELVVRRCAYWLSLRGREPTANRKSVRVLLPRANVFSVGALKAIMGRLKEGGEP
jgi:hypothetical protein